MPNFVRGNFVIGMRTESKKHGQFKVVFLYFRLSEQGPANWWFDWPIECDSPWFLLKEKGTNGL